MIHSLASPETTQNVCFFVPSILGDYQGDVLANRFFGCIAEQALRTLVPTRDDAVQILADDGIVGGINDSSQQPTRPFSLLSFGNDLQFLFRPSLRVAHLSSSISVSSGEYALNCRE